MARPAINLSGMHQPNGFLTAIEREIVTGNRCGKHAMWKCICECGNNTSVKSSHFLSESIISCGCALSINRGLIVKRSGYKTRRESKTRHGLARNGSVTTEYRAWQSIRERCYNKNNQCYKNYGGRGIKVCDRWVDSFDNFIEDMGMKPSPRLTIERIDNDRDYCKENCIWDTYKNQMNNRRSNIKVKYNGNIISLMRVSELESINYSKLINVFHSKFDSDVSRIRDIIEYVKK